MMFNRGPPPRRIFTTRAHKNGMKQARKRPSTYNMVTAERLKVFMLIRDGFRWRWSLVLLCSKRIWQQRNYQNHIKDNDHHGYERNKTILNSNSWPLRWLCSGIGCRRVMDAGGGWGEELTLRSFYYTRILCPEAPTLPLLYITLSPRLEWVAPRRAILV